MRAMTVAILTLLSGGAFADAGGQLVIDMDSTGLDVVPVERSTTIFDWSAHGAPLKTAWVGPHDGFLVYDENGNGVVDGVMELFGDKRAEQGFADLAATADSNNDGVVNDKDVVWPQLRIWMDVDGNGVSDPVELMTMEQAGVGSINTKYIRAYEAVEGVQVPWKSGVEMTDGSLRGIYDVIFSPAK